MKYLALLLLLVGCNYQLYSPKDCIRVSTDIISDFYIREIVGESYVVSFVSKQRDGTVMVANSKYGFKFSEFNSSNSKKIKCDEVE